MTCSYDQYKSSLLSIDAVRPSIVLGMIDPAVDDLFIPFIERPFSIGAVHPMHCPRKLVSVDFGYSDYCSAACKPLWQNTY